MKDHKRPSPTGRAPSPSRSGPTEGDATVEPGSYVTGDGDAVAHDAATLNQAANATGEAPVVR